MIAVPAGMRVLVATKPVDFRRGADSLAAWCASNGTQYQQREDKACDEDDLTKARSRRHQVDQRALKFGPLFVVRERVAPERRTKPRQRWSRRFIDI